MKASSELFTAFAVKSHTGNWSSEPMPASLWVRGGDNRDWSVAIEDADPYEILPLAVGLTPPHRDTEAMLLMYGWATNIEKPDVDSRVRVKVMLYLNRGKEVIATQFGGETIEEQPDTGGGMFADRLSWLRNIQANLPVEYLDDAGAVGQMASIQMLKAIYDDEEEK